MKASMIHGTSMVVLKAMHGMTSFTKRDVVSSFRYGNHPDDMAQCIKHLKASGFIENLEASRIRYRLTDAGLAYIRTSHVTNLP